jgi:ATP-dependent Clp protease ATP-binding subunit ClpA
MFGAAVKEARRMGDRGVDAEHVILAAIDSEDSLAGRVLRSFGLTKSELEQRIIELRGEGGQATPE